MKAQQVKNAVIVPVGAKGGFVPKHLPPPGDRQAWLAEGTESYRIFVRTLLQLTDNIVGDAVVPPPDTVRHDGDDPYLVVAADKGTATFSDTANALSIEKGHWLGDAFASGGSQGYDHKKMGITARGAWEAVKRHFREIDIDIQTQPVTVAGRRRHVGRRVRQRHAAVAFLEARGGLRPPRHLPRPESRPGDVVPGARAPVRPAALELAGLRQGAHLAGGGDLPRSAKSIPLSDEVARAARPRQGRGDAGRGDERDPEGRCGPALVRRHRHLYPRLDRDRRAGRRPRQRRDPHRRRGRAREGDRRGRESRRDAARAHRGRPRGRSPQHGRHRQLGRRQHLRRGGEHQDRPEPAGAGRTPQRGRPQRASGRHDRRGRQARPAQQLPADPGAFAFRAARRRRSRLRPPAHAHAGGTRPPQPHRGVPAGRRGPDRARAAAARP